MMRLLIGDKWSELDYDPLAEAIIKSPAPVMAAEVMIDCVWHDVSNKYERIRENRMNAGRIKNPPKYNPGDVLDLSYKNGGLPNRILVKTVYWAMGDTQWKYQVLLENTGEKSILTEDFIASRLSKKTSPVYQNPEIQRRIAEGWRFCGNFDAPVALSNAQLIAENSTVAKVRLYPALSYNNQYLEGKKGIWIIYEHMISNDGTTSTGTSIDDVIDVK